MSGSSLLQALHTKAIQLGFDACGVARTTYLEEEAGHLQDWLNRGLHANLSYMERNPERRSDPGLLLEGTQSVIVLLESYYTDVDAPADAAPIGRYAWLRDYHVRMKERLFLLDAFLREQTQEKDFRSRCFVDTAPIMEKAWAVRAGLGWIGKNTLFIHPKLGSFLNIGVIICNDRLGEEHEMKALNADLPIPRDGCGSCCACSDRCPAQALISPYVLASEKCYAHLWSQPYPNENELTLIGCDACQDPCPWNKKAFRKAHPKSALEDSLYKLSLKEWSDMSDQTYKALCTESPFYKKGLDFISGRARSLKNTIFANKIEK